MTGAALVVARAQTIPGELARDLIAGSSNPRVYNQGGEKVKIPLTASLSFQASCKWHIRKCYMVR